MFKLWELYQDHEEDIQSVLKKTRAIPANNLMGVRKWGKEENEGLRELGHSALSFSSCRCNPFPGQEYKANRSVPNDWRAPDMEKYP